MRAFSNVRLGSGTAASKIARLNLALQIRYLLTHEHLILQYYYKLIMYRTKPISLNFIFRKNLMKNYPMYPICG